MIGITKIMGLKEQEIVVKFFWETKGREKNGYSIKSLFIYLDEHRLEQLNDTTKSKVEMLIGEVFRLRKLKKIKSELDLEIIVNAFMTKHSPAILFNSRKHFTYSYRHEAFPEARTLDGIAGFVKVDDKYFKRKFNELRKSVMKTVINKRKEHETLESLVESSE